MPGGLSPAAAALKRQPTSELNQSRIVHLSGSDAAKVGDSRVRIRGIKARMIEDVEGVEAELPAHPLPSLDEVDVLIESDIGFVHAAGTDVVPASGIGADKISEVLVHAVAEAFLDIRSRGLVIVTGQVLDARPRGVSGDIGVLGREGRELRRVEPLAQRLPVTGKRGIFSAEERGGAEDDRDTGLNRILPRQLP
jgi:hypothetical protein